MAPLQRRFVIADFFIFLILLLSGLEAGCSRKGYSESHPPSELRDDFGYPKNNNGQSTQSILNENPPNPSLDMPGQALPSPYPSPLGPHKNGDSSRNHLPSRAGPLFDQPGQTSTTPGTSNTTPANGPNPFGTAGRPIITGSQH